MNKDRRARIASLRARLDDIDAELSGVLSEEEEALENMPESMKVGHQAAEMEEVIERLTDACGDIEQAIGTLGDFQ
jgi:uncharacterized protein YhaN